MAKLMILPTTDKRLRLLDSARRTRLATDDTLCIVELPGFNIVEFVNECNVWFSKLKED